MINKSWVQEKIKALKLAPSRGNGQNFLISPDPIIAIIKAGEITAGDRVLEIGPGLGALTEALLATGADVTAIEFDKKLAEYLEKNLSKKLPHKIIHGDVLEIATENFLADLHPYKLIANIPYHLTSDIIRRFTETKFKPQTICLLVQKEVAERITAEPPRTNQLALFTQWFARVEYITTIPRTLFSPAPEVDSAIIRIVPRTPDEQARGLSPNEQKQLFSFIKRGYAHPRKQLANNLGVKITDAPLNLTRRAETLSHEEWITLFKALS